MAIGRKPGKNKGNHTAEESIRKRINNLYPSGEDIPTALSIRQVDALRTRIAELEAELAQVPGEAVGPLEPAAETRTEALPAVPAGPPSVISPPGPDPSAREGSSQRFNLRSKLILAIASQAAIGVEGLLANPSIQTGSMLNPVGHVRSS